MKRFCFFNVIVLLVIYLQTFQSSGIAKQPSFQRLGGVAYDISADGSVVVGQSGSLACKWQNGAVTILGDLAGGADWSEARGVSADGSVIVGTSGCSWGSISGLGAFRWTQSGGMVSLGEIGGSNMHGAQAYGVSADGSVITGWSHGSKLGGSMEAFRWTSSGGMQPLGFLPGGDGSYYYSVGYAVSADGSKIAGVDNSTNPSYSAVKWDNNGNITKLARTGDTVHNTTDAYGISADGSVIVGTSYYGNAAIWNSNGQIEVLGKMSGTQYVTAYDVSGNGGIVVGGKWDTAYGEGNGGAFIWDRLHGMRSLQTFLTGYGIDLTGWTLTAASGVSYDGQTLVGYGINPQGSTEGWIATIPEPATILLLGLGTVIINKRSKIKK
jgi:probable HAF family extracellular repeat protein